MNTDLFKTSFLEKLVARKNYDLFGSDIHADLHWGKLFVHLFGDYYSRYRMRINISHESLYRIIIENYSLDDSQIIRIERAYDKDPISTDYSRSETLFILKKGFMLGIYDDNIDMMYSSDISVAERSEMIKVIEQFKVSDQKLSNFYMVQSSKGCFDLTNFEIKPFDLDIRSHYNDDFEDIHKLIIRSLTEKEKNGLILLHGKYGSGKTYYLRHLINKVERKFIYFPANMIESLSSPEFLPFISSQPDSVLILEDCESLLIHRESGLNNASSLSNLLNLGDGLLADALSINAICTFNAGIKKIDDAILRKGRLLARYEFKELEISKSRALAQKIGKECSDIDHPMTVSEIYNLNDSSFENSPAKKIGFKAA